MAMKQQVQASFGFSNEATALVRKIRFTKLIKWWNYVFPNLCRRSLRAEVNFKTLDIHHEHLSIDYSSS